ncbi:hypothetical protein NYO98_07880 [Nocardioides sp. STR2]|uniref:Membrane protein YfhO n=1 Tax=Nocardioides pini TaxID=2975053 RepID=A0ABT4CBI8_9ACTN|nr:hypothetical protein [Nocardioides pini]MCY4726196.1 hypothetical protein [Nocardioides pini]
MEPRVEGAMPRARVLLWPTAWAAVLAVLLLGGALGPGYVLSYDMVWVPDLALTRDVLGLGSALPRAVPSDAVVAALDEVLGGAVLQKVVLAGTLMAAGTGFAALVRHRTTTAQLVAVSVGMWNPFVVERLLLGHWPLLIGYAVMPWLVVALHDIETGRARLPARVPLLVVLGSLSASAGLATALVAFAVTGRRLGRRGSALLAACVVGANAPWIVAGLVSPATSASDPLGAVVFATSDEGLMAGPVAALSVGGVWNAEVVPGSRLGLAGLAFTLLLVCAAVTGAVLVARGEREPRLRGLFTCWCVGWGLAVVSWAAPGAIGWLGDNVPAGGLFRDGSRLLGLTVPLVVVLVAVAVDGLVRLPERGAVVVVGGVLALLPVSLMPDAAWGAGGRLDAVHYPAAYDDARSAVAGAPPGDAVSLPFVSYRAPAWNGGRRVLDPLPRYLDRPTVVNDELVVSGRALAGEDPASAAVARALREPTPAERSAALRRVGVSVVVAEQIEGYQVPVVEGRRVLAGGLSVTTLGAAPARTVSGGRWAAVLLAWGAWLSVLLVSLASRVRRGRATVTRQ